MAELAAVALASEGRPEAAATAQAALRGYADIGAEHDLSSARSRLRRAGIQVRGRRASRPTTGWEPHADRGEVARHVARGATNPEIAEVFCLSRRTIETHVTHILAKLGVRSRTELVLRFARRADDVGEQREQVHPPA